MKIIPTNNKITKQYPNIVVYVILIWYDHYSINMLPMQHQEYNFAADKYFLII